MLLAMAWALGVFAIALVVRFGASAAAFAWLRLRHARATGRLSRFSQ